MHDHHDSVGCVCANVKVLCPLWGPAVGSIGGDLNAGELVSFVTEMRQYRALLGYGTLQNTSFHAAQY